MRVCPLAELSFRDVDIQSISILRGQNQQRERLECEIGLELSAYSFNAEDVPVENTPTNRNQISSSQLKTPS